MRKIWIPGGFGMLGTHFRQQLLLRQELFLATDHKSVDIANLSQVLQFVKENGISHIINCAAYTKVDLAEEEREEAFRINAEGPYHLGVAAEQYGAFVLHFSTDYVFNGLHHAPYLEEEMCQPCNVYGASKLQGELKLREATDNCCIIRTSWLFGQGKNFVASMLRLMQEKEHMRIVFDQRGRPTYCEDLMLAALFLLDTPGLFHFANEGETSWYLFAQEIYKQAKALGFALKTNYLEPVPASEYRTAAKRPSYSVLDTKKMQKTLKQPIRPWQEALHDYLIGIKTSVYS